MVPSGNKPLRVLRDRSVVCFTAATTVAPCAFNDQDGRAFALGGQACMRRSTKAFIVVAILASVIWAVGAWHHSTTSQLESAKSFAELSFQACKSERLAANKADMAPCEEQKVANMRKWLAEGNYTGNNLFISLVPIPFIWLGLFLLLYIVRVQIAGIHAAIPWGSVGIAKKVFIVFCVLCLVITALFITVDLLNGTADSRVPVGLAFDGEVTNTPDFVSATGTWVRTDLTDDSIANPIQTSEINCNRDSGQCIQSTAYVMGDGSTHTLGTELDTFQIDKWSSDAVVFSDVRSCATTVYTIDLNTKVVSGAGHLTNQGDTLCKMNSPSKDHWSIQLEKGFGVYSKLRQAARPWLLRVIQTVL